VFIRDAWYVAALANEIADEVLFRTASRTPVAMLDHTPARGRQPVSHCQG
jgi:hypothetical protein